MLVLNVDLICKNRWASIVEGAKSGFSWRENMRENGVVRAILKETNEICGKGLQFVAIMAG
jgi:hypothetical protein